MIDIRCPNCGQHYRLKPELAGRKVRCRQCADSFVATAPNEIDDQELFSDEFAPAVVQTAVRRKAASHASAKRASDMGFFADQQDLGAADDDGHDEDWDQAPRRRNERPYQSAAMAKHKAAKARRSSDFDIPIWAIIGVPSFVASVATLFLVVIPMLRGPSISEKSGVSQEIVDRFENAGDVPLGSPAPAEMKPSVGPPVRDLSGPLLVIDEMLKLYDELSKTWESIHDLPSLVVAENKLRFLNAEVQRLKQLHNVLDMKLTKKEESLLSGKMHELLAAYRRQADQIKRVENLPEIGEVFKDDPALKNAKEMFRLAEMAVSKMAPPAEIGPEGDRSQYAEIRVVGANSPTMKAYVEAQIRASTPIKYMNSRQEGDAPARFAIWPVESIPNFLNQLRIGKVVHQTGNEIWVVLDPLPEEEAKRLTEAALADAKSKYSTQAERILQQRAEASKATASPSPTDNEFASNQSSSTRAGQPDSNSVRGKGSVSSVLSTGEKVPASVVRRAQDLPKDADAMTIALTNLHENRTPDDALLGLVLLLKLNIKGREKEIIDVVGPQLASTQEENVDAALTVLDKIDDPRRVDLVIARLGKRRNHDEMFCNVLASWKDPRAIQPLVDQIDMFPSNYLDEAIVSFGSKAEEAVIEKLSDVSHWIRSRACKLLAKIGGERSLKAFKSMRPDSDTFVRIAANEAIISIRNRVGTSGRRPSR
jgi:predicted Zn finger-like uncharacterized protein